MKEKDLSYIIIFLLLVQIGLSILFQKKNNEKYKQEKVDKRSGNECLDTEIILNILNIFNMNIVMIKDYIFTFSKEHVEK